MKKKKKLITALLAPVRHNNVITVYDDGHIKIQLIKIKPMKQSHDL